MKQIKGSENVADKRTKTRDKTAQRALIQIEQFLSNLHAQRGKFSLFICLIFFQHKEQFQNEDPFYLAL